MSLTNSQYDELMREYDRRRSRQLHQQTARLMELDEKVPGYRDLTDSIHEYKSDKLRVSLSAVSEEEKTQQLAELDDKIARCIDTRNRLCIRSGYPEDYGMLRYDCEECRDTGFLPNKEKCSCFTRQAINLLYSKYNMADIIGDDCFDNFSLEYYPAEVVDSRTNLSSRATMESTLQTCRDYVESFAKNPGWNMILQGNTGTGKTKLTHCIARELIEQCFSVVYLTAPQLEDIFGKMLHQSDYRNSREDPLTGTYSDYLYDSDLLIVDDLGTELTNSLTISALQELITTRGLRKKGMIISTNLTNEQLRDIYAERLFSRIFSDFEHCETFGPDIRLKG